MAWAKAGLCGRARLVLFHCMWAPLGKGVEWAKGTIQTLGQAYGASLLRAPAREEERAAPPAQGPLCWDLLDPADPLDPVEPLLP